MKTVMATVLVGAAMAVAQADNHKTQENSVMATQTAGQAAVGGKRTAELSVDLKATPEQVWRALTDAKELTRWFPMDAKVKPGVGGSIWSSWGEGVQWESAITIWEPGKRLRTLWCPPTTPEPDLFGVDFYIEDKGGGTTRLRLVHFGFSKDPQWDAMYDGVSRGWDFMFWGIKEYMEKHPGEDRKVVYIHKDLKVSKDEAWKTLLSPGGFLGNVNLTGLKPGDTFKGQLDGQEVTGKVRVNLPGKDFQASIQTMNGAMVRFQTDPCKSHAGEEFSATIASFGVEGAKIERIEKGWRQRMDSATGG